MLPDVAARSKQALNARTVGDSLHLDLSGDALFDTAQSDLNANATDSLRRVSEILAAYPDGMVEIRGYTDDTGDANANIALSKRRAESVQQWLQANGGLKTQSVTTQGLGSANPVASNATDEGRKQNRRVEIVVSKR
jgi:outer membrane protein OmpA-like peptidoglycan-associated protein